MNILLSSAYLPPIQYFARLYTADTVYLEMYENYIKQSYRNRAIIATECGPLALSIPVLRTGEVKRTIKDLQISQHGRWQQLHWRALEAAYDHSPYFFYYADEFRPFYTKVYKYLFDFNEQLILKVYDLLSMEPNILYTDEYEKSSAKYIEDARESIHPKIDCSLDTHFFPVKYHQVFEQKNGFFPNMCILDLLFNMGPESRLVLKKSYVR